MKLSNTHKKQWVGHCIKSMLPVRYTDITILESKGDIFLRKVYKDWYNKHILPYEGLEIMKACNKSGYLRMGLKYGNAHLESLVTVQYNQPNHYGRWVPGLDSYIGTHGFYDISSPKDDLFKITNSTHYDISDELYEEYKVIKEEYETANKEYELLAKTVYKAIHSVTTDKQLQERFPAIYANMPESVSKAINDSIVTINARKKLHAKQKAMLMSQSGVELSPEEAAYKDAEFALQKAAFVAKAQ